MTPWAGASSPRRGVRRRVLADAAWGPIRSTDTTHTLCQDHSCGGTRPPTEGTRDRHRGGRQREPMLHADAARLLAEADDPPSATQTILLALRGGRPGKPRCLACGKAAQHCQLWLPPALFQAVPDLREHPTVSWLCATHHDQLADAEIVAVLGRRGRGGPPARCAGRHADLCPQRTPRRAGAGGKAGIRGRCRPAGASPAPALSWRIGD